MRIDQLTSPEVKQILQDQDPTAVLPTGSTEQHGDHLPLNTDIFLAEKVVSAACKHEESHALSLPSIAYGYNEKELCFPGTMSMTARTFTRAIEDIGRSLYRTGWKRFLIVNGHGWNMDLVRTATHILNEQRDFHTACCSYWSLCSPEVNAFRDSEIPGGMAHAGEFETSLMLYLCPEAVRSEKIKDEISYKKSQFHHHDLFCKSPIFMPEPFERLSNTGVIGTPSAASADKGKTWFEAAVKNLANFLIQFRCLYPSQQETT